MLDKFYGSQIINILYHGGNFGFSKDAVKPTALQ